jgi:large subunit ribosomal protein L25
VATEVEVICLPANLPEFLQVDLKDVAVGTTLHLTDIALPAGVEIAVLTLGASHNQPIANVHKSKADE